MKLQTTIPLSKQPHNLIDYGSKLLLLGSCFSENIGEKFNYFQFQSLVNPFGILFHPLAIENLITRAINSDYYTADDLCFHNEQWLCLDAHSKLNSDSKDALLSKLNEALKQTLGQLSESTHVVVTLGTAWVYRHIATDDIVANCHKLPQKEFQKELLSVDTIAESLEAIISLIRSVNPGANIIFTVSPVRHIKDGFVENTQSKSHLLAAVHRIVESRKQNFYFSSYEIMMDELRDYRFYKEDMIHPSSMAIDHIWDKFKLVWLSDNALKIYDKIASIQLRKNHRPLNPNSVAHKKFTTKLNSEIEEIRLNYPHISL